MTNQKQEQLAQQPRKVVNFLGAAKNNIIDQTKLTQKIEITENEVIARSYYLALFFEGEVDYGVSMITSNLSSFICNTLLKVDPNFDLRLIGNINGDFVKKNFKELYNLLNYYDFKITPNISNIIGYNVAFCIYNDMIKSLCEYQVNDVSKIIEIVTPIFTQYSRDITTLINHFCDNAMNTYLGLGGQKKNYLLN